MNKILVVEDEAAIADTLIHVLTMEGFDVQWLTLGSDALELLRQQRIDLVILDVGLPDINGFEVCKQIRQFSDLPIIFLTARAQEIDRVVGLEIGADDYVTKPFSPREVSARVKVILKRMLRQKDINGSPENISTLQLTSSGCDYQYQQHSLGLTSLEFKLLAHLVSHPDNVFSRDQLLTACGQANDAGYERNIDSHIKSIRHKARLCHPDLDIIKTHRGFGYSHPSKVIS